jgi:small nuclear ribonucleoprotein (snRNP)-like protein
LILNNAILSTEAKNLLFEYINCNDVHSVLNITFQDLLLNTYSLILKNEHKDEIFKIMDTEMKDSLCKCFTGRLSRLVNVLNGFDENINITINDNEQIGNIIISIKNNMEVYDIEKHKKLVYDELTLRGFNEDVIKEWIDFI